MRDTRELRKLTEGVFSHQKYDLDWQVGLESLNKPAARALLNLGQQMTALMAVLMLRGPQTPGELRAGCDRMYKFADISSVEAFLEDMAVRPARALVMKLSKQPGSREHRWAQLLSGPVEVDAHAGARAEQDEEITIGELAALKSNLAQVRDELAELRALVERLYQELGVAR